MVDKPIQPLLETGKRLDHVSVKCLDCKQRSQSDCRSYAQRKVTAVWSVQHIVIEAILWIPQAKILSANIVHGVRDVNEVLPKLTRDIFVGRILSRQLQRNRQQVQ